MAQRDCTLLVRHLSSELSDEKKIDLLKHFGATRVKVMGMRGSMKHTAFATFGDANSAKQALNRLHQLDVSGIRLLAEFAKTSQDIHFPQEGEITDKFEDACTKIKTAKNDDLSNSGDRLKEIQDEVFVKFGIKYPRHPGLTYLYPPPTVSTLTNIANALASHPKFYIQVLHLMNKLNLPAPFGPATPTPPIIDDAEVNTVAMEISASEESEMESDPDIKSKNPSGAKKRPLKRKKPSDLSTKRPKFIPPPLPAPVREPSYITPTPRDVFDTPDQGPHKKISLNLPPNVVVTSENSATIEAVVDDSSADKSEPHGGFGTIQPLTREMDDSADDSDGEVTIDPARFISLSGIKSKRISTGQMADFACFKNYAPGEPSSRIYVKNLSRKTTEEDLTNLFGSYADYDTEEGRKMFYVQLMEGRMKGQAFVTLMSEVQAKSAVRHVNGYLLHDKPIVVQFARTAKPKDPTTDKK